MDWPNCPVPGCTNKICLALNSDRCFPHTPGNKHVKWWKIAARNATGTNGRDSDGNPDKPNITTIEIAAKPLEE